ncbi:MAG: DUF6279 family lipoprotein [Candidatus Competibacterales bacterium]
MANLAPSTRPSRPRLRRLWPLALGLALILVTSGCLVRWTYNQLDWLIPWYLDDYVDFTGTQRDLLDQRLGAMLQWHRYTQLPVYAQWLEDATEALADGLERQELLAIEARGRNLLDAFTNRILPDFAELLGRLDDAQVQGLLAKIEADNREFHRERVTLDLEARRRDRIQRAEEQLRRWTGDSTPAQRARLRAWSESAPALAPELWHYREDWRAYLAGLLAERRDRSALRAGLTTLLLEPDDLRRPAYRRQRELGRLALVELALDLDALLSSRQRQHLLGRLESYALDFRRLADQPCREPVTTCRGTPPRPATSFGR